MEAKNLSRIRLFNEIKVKHCLPKRGTAKT